MLHRVVACLTLSLWGSTAIAYQSFVCWAITPEDGMLIRQIDFYQESTITEVYTDYSRSRTAWRTRYALLIWWSESHKIRWRLLEQDEFHFRKLTRNLWRVSIDGYGLDLDCEVNRTNYPNPARTISN